MVEVTEKPVRGDVDIIAHALTGHINGVCCHKTGGYKDDPKCECREIARDVLAALASPAEVVGAPPPESHLPLREQDRLNGEAGVQKINDLLDGPAPVRHVPPFSQPRCQCAFPMIKFGGNIVACQHCGLPPGRSPAPVSNVMGWQPIETAPVNGPNFIAWVIDRVDEYDEDDRLVARGKRVGNAVIAQCVSFTGGRGEVVEVPWKFVDRREYTHWIPLPAPPATTEGSAE